VVILLHDAGNAAYELTLEGTEPTTVRADLEMNSSSHVRRVPDL